MIHFNATVCHPHWCVLVIMGSNSEALRPPVVVLSCAAILLAAAIGGPGGGGGGGSAAVNNNYACRKAGNNNDGNAQMAMLPHFWWRALDVSTEDKECTWEGGGDARKSTHF
jgi:hypothetical protein